MEEQPGWRERPSTAARFAITASEIHSCIPILRIANSNLWRFCRQQKVKCSKKKGIIIGIVVATLFGLSKLHAPAFSSC